MNAAVEALGAAQRAIDLHDDFAEAWSNKGMALEKLGRLDGNSAGSMRRSRRTGMRRRRGKTTQGLDRPGAGELGQCPLADGAA
jgi:hypothetical protein